MLCPPLPLLSHSGNSTSRLLRYCSHGDSRLAPRKYARIVQKLGFDAKFAEFKIQNIAGSCDVKFPIRLEGLTYNHGEFSSYEPEVRYLNARVVFIHIYLAVP